MWYAQSGPRSKDTGKFHTRKPGGTEKHGGEKYRDWSYEFVSNQTGTSVKRINYHVTIIDPFGNRVEYLRGFSSIENARIAAHEWIDELLSKMMPTLPKTNLGTIPSVPNGPVA